MSAIHCDKPNATASGAADATRPDVRGYADKYATRTFSQHATASGAADMPCPAISGRDNKNATKTLNILQLNINGTQKKIDELSCLLHDNNIHVACLQETKLNPRLNLEINGYTVIRKDRLNNPGGGLAFLVKTSAIKFEEFAPIYNSLIDYNTEAHAINILLPKCKLTIVNVYHPNNSDIDIDYIKHLCSSSSSDIKILLGDFNAKSPSWGCPCLDKNGEAVEDLLTDLNFSPLNSGENTYLSKTNGTASVLDITTVDHKHLDIAEWNVIKTAISDHFPVITTLQLEIDSVPQNNRSWNFRKANWGNFTKILEASCSQISTIRDLNKLVQAFTHNIQRAAKSSIPRGKRKPDWVPYWKDNNIDALIRERDSISTELEHDNDGQIRRKLIDISHKIEEEISSCKRRKWAEFCDQLDPRQTSQHWKVIKVLNNRCTQSKSIRASNILTSNGLPATTDREAAEILAQHYEKTSKLSFTKDDRKQKKTLRRIINQNKMCRKNIFSDALTLEELDSAIQDLDQNKSPGIDLIFGHMIKHFGQNARLLLLQIFNLSWRTGKLPSTWKTSIIVPILKQGKVATECKSFRPISLTSTLCKLMERIIHTRIMTWITQENVLQFYQTAYRTKHSTVDQLFYLVQSIIDGLQEKPHKKTTAVFLDLSAAFDRVWRHKLIEIVHKAGISGNSLLWINDFLRERKFVVRLNGKYSKTHRLWAGVPQGSVLSPLLFLLYMNTIHEHIGDEAKIACYADDIAIWHTHCNVSSSESALNNNLKRIQIWADSLKLMINPEKTNFCIFTTDRKNRKNFHPTLKIFNSTIEQVTHPKYLGVILDAELRFSKHITLTSNRAQKKLNILRKLCGSSWGSKPMTLLDTYTTVIRPILEYAAPIWAPASSTLLEKIDVVQFRASKIIIGAVSSTNNTKAEMECDLVPLKSRRKLATVKFTNKIRCNNDEHISTVTYRNWTAKTRLHRSSTLQYDKDIRKDINLEHSGLIFIKEPEFPIKPPPSVKINLELSEPCTKKEPHDIIKQKGLKTIAMLSSPEMTIVYTDGSSDSNCDRGGAGIFYINPDGSSSKHKFPAGKIASNFTSELVAIREALSIYSSSLHVTSSDGVVIFSDCKSALQAIQGGSTSLCQEVNNALQAIVKSGKKCILQWIPAHVDIDGNEQADTLAKDARTLNTTSGLITLADANAVAKHRLFTRSRVKFPAAQLNCPREVTSTIARIRTGHLRGMKIMPDGSRTYASLCPHCPSTRLDHYHLFFCPAMASALFNIDTNWTKDIIFSEYAEDVARAVLRTFGPI